MAHKYGRPVRVTENKMAVSLYNTIILVILTLSPPPALSLALDPDAIVFQDQVKEAKQLIYQEKEKETKVKYGGAQVWNIAVDQDKSLRVLGNLTRSEEISSWGGDHAAVDCLVKREKVARVSQILADNGISYTVVMDDVQRYIDQENPPLPEEDEDLQQRQGRAYRFWQSYRVTMATEKGTRRVHRISMPVPVPRPADRHMWLLGAYLGYNSLDDHMEYWPDAEWGHRLTWKKYHRLSDIHGFLDFLATSYPSICSVMSIGKSHGGRDLKVLRISNGNPENKAVWIDGGIHAREWISPATVTYIINHIAENYESESDTLRSLDWYFLPVVNPDGYEYSHTVDRLWRKNRRDSGIFSCSGTDLNRNFGYKWGGKGTSSNQCSEIYAGSSAFSEPESKAMANFIMNAAANFTLYVSYHSYGQYILYPWGYDKAVPEDHMDLDAAGKAAASAIARTGGSVYQVGASSIVLYPAAGASDDWAKAVARIKYSYTIELNDKGRYGFILPASYIIPVATESLAGVRVLAEAAAAAAKL